MFTDRRRLLGDRGGATAVEFGLLAPVLCLLVVGLVDCSVLIVRTMEVRAAAQAGADYAFAHGWDAAKIQTAVTSAADSPLAISADPAPVMERGCVVGQSITAPTAGACPAGSGAPGDFITVSARAHFAPIFPWPGFGQERDLVSRATVRIG